MTYSFSRVSLLVASSALVATMVLPLSAFAQTATPDPTTTTTTTTSMSAKDRIQCRSDARKAYIDAVHAANVTYLASWKTDRTTLVDALKAAGKDKTARLAA